MPACGHAEAWHNADYVTVSSFKHCSISGSLHVRYQADSQALSQPSTLCPVNQDCQLGLPLSTYHFEMLSIQHASVLAAFAPDLIDVYLLLQAQEYTETLEAVQERMQTGTLKHDIFSVSDIIAEGLPAAWCISEQPWAWVPELASWQALLGPDIYLDLRYIH